MVNMEIKAVIIDLMRVICEEAGVNITPDISHRVEAIVAKKYGGERIYVPKVIKRQRQLLLFDAARLPPGRRAAAVGVSARHLRRIKNGK